MRARAQKTQRTIIRVYDAVPVRGRSARLPRAALQLRPPRLDDTNYAAVWSGDRTRGAHTHTALSESLSTHLCVWTRRAREALSVPARRAASFAPGRPVPHATPAAAARGMKGCLCNMHPVPPHRALTTRAGSDRPTAATRRRPAASAPRLSAPRRHRVALSTRPRRARRRSSRAGGRWSQCPGHPTGCTA